jgi:hypothetical protein
MLSETDIVTTIMGFAARCGDPAPSAIRYVYGTRSDLNRLLGATMESADAATPAVLVEATGNFSWPRPVGLRPNYYPRGNVITLVIDDVTGTAVDAGIRREPHDLSRLGEIHHPALPD